MVEGKDCLSKRTVSLYRILIITNLLSLIHKMFYIAYINPIDN